MLQSPTRLRHPLSLLTSAVVVGVLAANCGGEAEVVAGDGGAGGSAGSGASAGSTNGGSAGSDGGTFNLMGGAGGQSGSGGSGGSAADGPGPSCGDGTVDAGEKCDDGNADSGDGCAGDCSAIEQDFACPTPGMPCVSTVMCGDGKISGQETCDDNNTSSGDGCDSSCTVEAGWTCPQVGSRCEAAACGDGIIAGNEQCEDDDTPPASGDGCSELCQLEPGFACDTPGMPCRATVCGDGTAEGSEDCDDGNNDMGDGCTPFCEAEPTCTTSGCTSTCGDGIKLPSDTNEECEDGNTVPGDGCDANCKIEPGYDCQLSSQTPTKLDLPLVLRDFKTSHPDMEFTIATEKNIVTGTLGANGKPVYNAPTTTVNSQATFDQWYTDVPGTNQTILQTMTLNQVGNVFRFDDSTFFPLNGLGFGNEGNSNNFHFTSEVRYYFEYKGGEQLDFTGDDDVWVFVNKQLAVDLGGVHGAQNGSVTLDATAATTYNLTVGTVYEIVVFQAERHTSQSNYRLTLSGFTNQISTCKPVCGDGILTPDEQCDDGVNDGSYGSCTPDCKRGPRCGDGLVQDPPEECDDGINLTPYEGCAPGCKNGAFCGDGNVDSLFGEQCDDGVNDGGYGECAEDCLLGPRCGDGKLQTADGEACDDGNRTNGDGCDANCQPEGPA